MSVWKSSRYTLQQAIPIALGGKRNLGFKERISGKTWFLS